MPQLNKGGKYVFGLSAISNRNEILFLPRPFCNILFNKKDALLFSRGAKSRADFVLPANNYLSNQN